MKTTHNARPFLQQVADDLAQRFPDGLNGVTVVFPNRRARLFLNEHLFKAYGHAIWEPNYSDFNELLSKPSNLHAADTIELVYYLYKAMVKVYEEQYHKPYTETFDEFYYFGEVLLRDFDDIDKYLVDPHQLFVNLEEYHKFDDTFSHLSEEQRTLIDRFFNTTKENDDKESKIKRRFAEIWNILSKVYTRLNQTLDEKGVAYPGKMARRTIEKLETEDDTPLFNADHYVFVGFNVLSACEETIFKHLKDKALFYWDVDAYFLDNDVVQEAGRFLRQNIQKFPNALPKVDSALEAIDDITIVEAPNDIIQTAYVATWVKSLNKTSFLQPDTAIVLGDENLLGVTLRNLPAEVDAVNITMGYPLAQTPISTFVQLTANLVQICDNETLRLESLITWLEHPYARYCFNTDNNTNNNTDKNTDKNTNTPAEQCAELKKKLVEKHQFKLSLKELENESTTLSMLLHVVRSTTTTDFLASLLALLQDISYGAIELEPLQREALSRVVKLLGRLTDILNKEVELELTTVLHLISRLMNTESIPYHGEPKEGLQVMGMLETRNMDFDNLLLLSVNEGKIPKITSTASSFIPNLLRKAFGMSYTDHQDSLYAYHFYHLLQRTKHVTLVYSAGKGNVSKNEVSRFVLQLLAEHPNSEQFRRIRLQPEFKVADIPPVKVEKSEQSIQEALNNIKSLSPSAINKYIDCQLRFYYDCVLKLKEEDELTDEIDNATMGNLFHKSMELCYKDIKKSKSTTQNAEEQDISITANDINALLLDKEHIRNIVLSAYNSVCFNNEKAPLIGEEKFSGEQKIYYTLIVDYVNRQLRVDLKQAPFTVRGLEKKHYVEHTLTDKSKTLEIGGILDRHDKADINGIEYDIIKDYKTSKAAQEIKNKKDESLIESLFNDKGKRPYHVFQILIYAWVLKKEGAKHIKPRLYYVNTFNNQDEKDYHKLGDIPFFDVYNDDMHKEFDEKLTKLLDEIFAVSKPFEPTNNTSHCKYCPYATICFKDKDSGDE